MVIITFSLGLMVSIMSKSLPPHQMTTVSESRTTVHSKDSTIQIRDTCVSNSFGIPSSLVESGCLGGICNNVTCERLFAGDPAAIGAARNFRRRSLSDDKVYQLASDCDRLRHLGDYRMTPVRATDVDLPIAFTILLHLNAEQFERLLRAIYRPQNVYCVHFDTKSSKSFQSAVKAIVNCFPNVFIASRLHYVVYAGPSRLQVSGRIVDTPLCDYLGQAGYVLLCLVGLTVSTAGLLK